MTLSVDCLEAQLNDFDPQRRREALAGLMGMVAHGEIVLPEPGQFVNLHAHTFYSYNGYGYSPSCYAWKARRAGLAVAGIVDFDVLDAVDEFLSACDTIGIKGCAGIETRVYVPEFAEREMTSPGEPGITYHMGVGCVSSRVKDAAFLASMKASAQQRNRGIVERVNAFLGPVVLDYERDVVSRTPNGNATERHVCEAYEVKAVEMFPDVASRASFWAVKLKTPADTLTALFDDSPAFQALIRAKTMKAGGVGYVKAEGPDFPRLGDVNAFLVAEGAIPTATWLDGCSAGEQAIDELLDLQMSLGTAAINIIPDRNWNIAEPETKRTKVANLHAIVANARARHLPIVVGTEMNAHGQRFVDDFTAPELAPYVDLFLDGAHIVYAHTKLQQAAGMGYLSDWARAHFVSIASKSDFYRHVGASRVDMVRTLCNEVSRDDSPESILGRLR